MPERYQNFARILDFEISMGFRQRDFGISQRFPIQAMCARFCVKWRTPRAVHTCYYNPPQVLEMEITTGEFGSYPLKVQNILCV